MRPNHASFTPGNALNKGKKMFKSSSKKASKMSKRRGTLGATLENRSSSQMLQDSAMRDSHT